MVNIPKQKNKFFVWVSILLVLIGLFFIVWGFIKQEVGSALFGITTIYEALNVYQGKVPKSEKETK